MFMGQEATPYYNPQYRLCGWDYPPFNVTHKKLNRKTMQTEKLISISQSKSGQNFTAYNAGGDRIHIPARQIEALGLTKDTLPKELFALTATKTFDELDPKTKDRTGQTFSRVQACSIFKTKEEMFAAKNDARLLNDECEAAYKKQASSLGLSVESIKALESDAV